MELTHIFLITMAGWWLGGFVNGIVGFGAALVAMPLVAFGNDMALAVTSCGLVVLALNVQMAWNYRSHLDCTGGSALFTGGIPGAVCGVLLLRHVPESGLKLGLGVLLIAYAFWGLCGTEPQPKRPGTLWGMLAGFFSTSLGTAFGVNGPPLAVYLSLRGGTQREIKAALGVFFIVSGLFILVAHGLAGLYTARSFTLFAAALPSVMFGAWAGMRVSKGFSDKTFRTALYVMLFVMGLNMVWKATSLLAAT